MWYPFKHKTIFTQSKKYCSRCFNLLKWKYDSSFESPRKKCRCCCHYYTIFYGDDFASSTTEGVGRTMRLL